MLEYSAHIECTVPGPEQKINFFIDSINYADITLQETSGLIRSNANITKEDFEASSSSFIEGDPFLRSSSRCCRNADVQTVDFKAGSGSSGVELRWHLKDELRKLSKEQK